MAITHRDREHDEFSTPGPINQSTGIPARWDEEVEERSDEISDTLQSNQGVDAEDKQ